MKISQTEARRLKRRVEQLEAADRARRQTWSRDYPGGVNIASTTYPSSQEFVPAVIATSRKLGHAVVATVDGNRVAFYALPHKDLPA